MENLDIETLIRKDKETTEPHEKKKRQELITYRIKDIELICKKLNHDTEEFNNEFIEELIKDFKNYINNYKRLLYSEVSKYIFRLSQERQGIFETNLDKFVNYVLEQEKDDEIKTTIIKLWDHVHLALCQVSDLRQNEEEFKKSFITNIEPVKTDLDKKFDNSHKEIIENLNTFNQSISSQLLSLIAIFTAMSFVVFGSISSLDNIFSGAFNIPITKLMIIGCIWGLCILNLVFVFMFFISKMTNLNMKSTTKKYANLIQKYPLVWYSNLVLIIILFISMLLYYISKTKLKDILFADNNAIPITIIAILAIIIIATIGFKIIHKNFNKDNMPNIINSKSYEIKVEEIKKADK